MLVLVTYDVSTQTLAGKKRLQRVAKCCVAHGQRVQNSVFECFLDESQYHLFQHELEGVIDKKTDSLRFYELGNNYHSRIVHIGSKPVPMPDEVLIV